MENQLFENMKTALGAEGLSRIQGLLHNVANGVVFSHPNPTYQALPPNLVFPGLPAPRPWWDPSVYPWIPELEAAKDKIVEEVKQQLANPAVVAQLEQYGQDESGADAGWRAMAFYKYFQENTSLTAEFPFLKSLLDRLPVGSDASISILHPGGWVKPHSDNYNFTLTCHLALDVPDNTQLTVGGVPQSWEEGKCWVFDHCYTHHGYNHGDRMRVVLILNVWHFDLSPKEIQCLKQFQPELLAFWMAASGVSA